MTSSSGSHSLCEQTADVAGVSRVFEFRMFKYAPVVSRSAVTKLTAKQTVRCGLAHGASSTQASEVVSTMIDHANRNTKQTRVYVDMVGDLFHLGHVMLLKAAREFGEWLIVGVISDEVASTYKRRPITNLAERIGVIEACRYVDEVLPNAPYRVTMEFLDEHDITVVVHGDDASPDTIEEFFGPVLAAGKLRLVRYTAGISTTDLIRRVKEYST
jgi:cytidyltransferase-like protein